MCRKVGSWLFLLLMLTACHPREAALPFNRQTLAETVKQALVIAAAYARSQPPPTDAPTSQPWKTGDHVIFTAADGAWLRSEPSHLSLDPRGMPVINAGVRARVMSKPEYEAATGQWWWLINVKQVGIGWVEESALTSAD